MSLLQLFTFAEPSAAYAAMHCMYNQSCCMCLQLMEALAKIQAGEKFETVSTAAPAIPCLALGSLRTHAILSFEAI